MNLEFKRVKLIFGYKWRLWRRMQCGGLSFFGKFLWISTVDKIFLWIFIYGHSAHCIIVTYIPPFGDCVSLIPGEDKNLLPPPRGSCSEVWAGAPRALVLKWFPECWNNKITNFYLGPCIKKPEIFLLLFIMASNNSAYMQVPIIYQDLNKVSCV